MSNYTQQQISDLTGFDCGDQFTSEDQVRDYFTFNNMKAMFVTYPGDDDNPALSITDDQLDAMADAVITNRWHMLSATTTAEA